MEKEDHERFLEDFGETLKKAEEIVEEVKNDPNNKYNFHLVSPQESRTCSIALVSRVKAESGLLSDQINLPFIYNAKAI